MSRRKKKLHEVRGFAPSSGSDARRKQSQTTPSPESATEEVVAPDLDAEANSPEPDVVEPAPEPDVEVPAIASVEELPTDAIATPEPEPPPDAIAIASEPEASLEVADVTDESATTSDRNTPELEPEAEPTLQSDESDTPTSSAVAAEPEVEPAAEMSDRPTAHTSEPEMETEPPQLETTQAPKPGDRDTVAPLQVEATPELEANLEPQQPEAETSFAAETPNLPDAPLSEAPVTGDLWEATTETNESTTRTNIESPSSHSMTEVVDTEPDVVPNEVVEPAIADADADLEPDTAVQLAEPAIATPPDESEKAETLSSASAVAPAPVSFKAPVAIAATALALFGALWQAYVDWAQNILPEGALSGRKLARRLGVSPNTIQRRKTQADFSSWTQSLDPDGYAWVYQQGIFVPKTPS